MRLSFRRLTLAVTVVAGGGLLFASAAWACLSVAGITANPATIQPGGTVTVNGIGFEFGTNPVLIHLDALNGVVLATGTIDHNGDFTTTATLPASISNGPHILIATEDAATPDGKNNGSNTGVPARAVIQVGNSAPAPVAPARLPAPVSASSIGTGTLVVISIAVAAVGLFLAGLLSVVASRRGREKPEYVQAS